MDIKQTKIENGTAHLKALLTQQEVETEKNHVIDEMIKTVNVKGFRQGKAPKNIAEKQLDPEKLGNHILNHAISHILDHAMEDHKYRLLGRPMLEDMKAEKTGEWTILLKIPLYPVVKLGDYHTYLKGKDKDKKGSSDEKEGLPAGRQAEDIYEILLSTEKVEISPLVIDEEVNHSLERLAGQAKTLNLPLEDYLKAIGKSLEQVREEYAQSAKKSIKLDIILLEIAKNEKIDTSEEELLELAKVSNVAQNQLSQLRSILNRRKTIDFLMKI